MWTAFKRQSTARQAIVICVGFVVVLLVAGASGGGNKDSSAPTQTEASTQTAAAPPDREVDRNTRAYVRQMVGCEVAVRLTRDVLRDNSGDPASLADATTQARDVCDGTRSNLLALTTTHFDDEAAVGFAAINHYKSGLNAVLAYIDNPRPTKVIEARDKLQAGDHEAARAHHEINQRRHVYGLKALAKDDAS